MCLVSCVSRLVGGPTRYPHQSTSLLRLRLTTSPWLLRGPLTLLLFGFSVSFYSLPSYHTIPLTIPYLSSQKVLPNPNVKGTRYFFTLFILTPSRVCVKVSVCLKGSTTIIRHLSSRREDFERKITPFRWAFVLSLLTKVYHSSRNLFLFWHIFFHWPPL